MSTQVQHKKKAFLRFTRHEVDPARLAAIQHMVGGDVEIINVDIYIQGNPVYVLCSHINRYKNTFEVVGIEIVAPAALKRKISARREELEVPAYYSSVKKDPLGKPIVVGKTDDPIPRDILVFDKYIRI